MPAKTLRGPLVDQIDAAVRLVLDELAQGLTLSSSGFRTVHARWRARGCVVLQAPTAMDFGYTFTVQDPDGHRVRVFAPEER